MTFRYFCNTGVLNFILLGLALLNAVNANAQTPSKSPPIANFIDIGEKSGLTMMNVFGGLATKKYIIETTGTGVAILDYDNDGWLDIFFVNGTTLEGKASTNHLYHNNHDGTFTDVTAAAGLKGSGWGQGVCVGDYDNDGWEDIFVTYYGKNRLFHNAKGVFAEVAAQANIAGSGKAWGTGCAFVDYDRDGLLDLVVANYVHRPGHRTNSRRTRVMLVERYRRYVWPERTVRNNKHSLSQPWQWHV